MKIGKLLLAGALILAMTATVSVAKEKTSVELGQKLFNDPKLGNGTSGQSCAACHPSGKGLEAAGDKKNLVEMINNCIAGPLKGTKIDGRSVEMRSLKLYIQSLAK